jgi:uncharacterized protein
LIDGLTATGTRADLPDWRATAQTQACEAAVAESKTKSADNGSAFNYRWEHVQTVVHLAIRLADLTGADRDVVEAAAWLHDVAKPHSPDHGRDGAIAARQILACTDFDVTKIDAVAQAIERHVGLYTAEPVKPLEAAVLWDADKLSKLGATAVLHTIGYGMMRGRGTTVEWLEELAQPLCAEATVESLHTLPARAAGRSRLQTYRRLWTEAQRELAGDDLVDAG